MSRHGKHPRRAAPAPTAGARRLLAVFVLLGVLALGAFFALKRGRHAESAAGGDFAAPAAANRAREDEQLFAQYGGSGTCKECHEEEYQSWLNSNHGQAERPVDPDRDRPAFQPPRTLGQDPQRTGLWWTNSAPQAGARGPSGARETFTIARVIGREPLRQFLVPFPGGRFQTLDASYAPRSNEWFNVFGNEDRQPGEWGHWTGRGMNWNYMCASCHNTRLRRNYDEPSDAYQTRMAEMSVGCEACHGPLKTHNDWQKQFGKSGRKDPTVPKHTHEQVLDYCGACHARRSQLAGDFKPGDNFFDDFSLVTVDHTERYYADGQVHDEDYEYASFLGSRMHERGVYCLDCHNPHSMKTVLPGNWLCLRCHDGSRTNAPVINPVAHSRHKVFGFDAAGLATNFDLTLYQEVKETGGECVNCHMPQTVYMQRHWRHDHAFTIPDPLLTKQFGIPNACNRCHQDKDADWALKYCDDWYGPKMERPTRRRAQIIARAQRGEPSARADLLAWLDQEPAPYWRAVTLGLLQPWSARPEVIDALAAGLEHTNPLVRTVAAAALEPVARAGGRGAPDALRRRLDDPVRSVRVAAAWSLRNVLDLESRAGRELRDSLAANADEPSGQLQTGTFFFSRNDLESALAHIRKAVGWDPYSGPMRQELAVVLSALNRPQEALETLQEGCRLNPRDADLHFHLGLAYNEIGDVKNAAAQLAAAVQLDPKHARARYNLGLAQSALGHTEDALASLALAEAEAPEDARIPYARATILARQDRTTEAQAAARRALLLDPGSAEARALLERLSN
jgi:tetratricopeptide (TPR) repeat protein